MGNNYRFKLSYMMPNAWFYKLKDMGRSRKQTSTTTTSQSRKKKHSSSTPTSSTKHSSKPKQQHQYNIPRKSYHFTRDLNLNLNYSHDTSDDILNTSPQTEKDLPTTNFHEPLRKSIKQRAKRRTSKTSLAKISYSSSSSPLELELYDPEFRTDNVLLATESLSFHDRVSLSNNNSSCGCKVLLSNNNTNNDIIIDVDNNSIARKDDKLGGDCDDPFSELVLPPIVTKPSTTKFNDLLSDDAKNNNNNNKETKPRSRMVTHKDQEHNVKGETRFTESKSLKGSLLKVKIVKEDIALMKEMRNNSSGSGGSRRLRLRINSPRIRSRKSVSSTAAAGSRRSLSNSFAIVKSSFNPERDFRESMMEMIVHNNIRGSKDLEDLLACYLSLNSDEYHHLIIKVFKQIWFDLIDNH